MVYRKYNSNNGSGFMNVTDGKGYQVTYEDFNQDETPDTLIIDRRFVDPVRYIDPKSLPDIYGATKYPIGPDGSNGTIKPSIVFASSTYDSDEPYFAKGFNERKKDRIIRRANKQALFYDYGKSAGRKL